MSYTPGPWTIEADSERGGWHIRHGYDEIAYVPPTDRTDARLIAAAPRMSVALGAIAMGGWPGFDDEDPRGPAGIARAAIAEARGD